MELGSRPLSRRDNIVIQEVQGELLIYDLSKNRAFCLNQTSAMIWQVADGQTSVAEIAQKLSKTLKSNVSEDLVWMALKQFSTDNLLDQSGELSTPLDNLSRREIVKRVGFASLVALPVVASIIAPTAVSAQSLACNCDALPGLDARLAGCPCVSNNDCCGNCNGQTGLCSGPLTTCLNPGAPCCPPNIEVPPAQCVP